ncbi:hypothetical protein TEA_001441 [Camellia sinensis var. sinensis]|uniref:UDP-glycosyltransferases domain-containing protein n=1 Tax=Camellia sinensis var. sinensis TaxID=542762 RepID=A0A4S4EZ13_CAMSN|nr:hypothetical protein TEA_001441 [Camellia sinensis var. sinensis]
MGDLQVFFFPMMSQGHMIPTLDIAKLFAARNGVKSTIITTPLNAHVFTKAIEEANHSGINISLRTIKFPTAEVGLPTDCKSFDLLTSDDMIANFFKAIAMFQDQLEQILQECCPDCLVADLFFPWTTESVGKFTIPRIVFHGISFFALCASENMRLYKPQKTVLSDDEPFVIPNLPHQIKLMRMQLPDHDRQEDMTNFSRVVEKLNEAELRSYRVIVNSFYELEPDYVENILGRRAWHIGPVSLCNKETKDKAHRGKEASINEHECLKWHNLKKPNSVIYICFGSVVDFPSS